MCHICNSVEKLLNRKEEIFNMEANTKKFDEFIRKYGAINTDNSSIEQAFVNYCVYIFSTPIETAEMENVYNTINVFCKNIAIKHLAENSFNIDFLVNFILGDNNILFEYDEEMEDYNYIGL